MAENSTTPSRGKPRPPYRVGDTIIFKFEGNVRARVEGHQVIDGKVWLEARADTLSFVVPSSEVIGVEPREDD